jgi:hypothetical protein
MASALVIWGCYLLGLLALPREIAGPSGGVPFFAGAKKGTKESTF